MKMYSYLVEGLTDGRWGWTVFGGHQKPVRSGSAKGEYEAKVAARNAIEELKKKDEERC
jgi:hypothetical protein